MLNTFFVELKVNQFKKDEKIINIQILSVIVTDIVCDYYYYMWFEIEPDSSLIAGLYKQGRIHGYRSRVRVGRGHIWGH